MPLPLLCGNAQRGSVFQVTPGVFFVSTYELINQVLRDPQTFSSSHGAAFLNFQGEEGLAPPTKPPPDIMEIMMQGVPSATRCCPRIHPPIPATAVSSTALCRRGA